MKTKIDFGADTIVELKIQLEAHEHLIEHTSAGIQICFDKLDMLEKTINSLMLKTASYYKDRELISQYLNDYDEKIYELEQFRKRVEDDKIKNGISFKNKLSTELSEFIASSKNISHLSSNIFDWITKNIPKDDEDYHRTISSFEDFVKLLNKCVSRRIGL